MLRKHLIWDFKPPKINIFINNTKNDGIFLSYDVKHRFFEFGNIRNKREITKNCKIFISNGLLIGGINLNH